MNSRPFHGFTLIEVLTASTILATVLVSLITFSAENLTASRDMEILVRATLLAERETERIKQALDASQQGQIAGWSNTLGNGFIANRTLIPIRANLDRVDVSVGHDTNGNLVLDAAEVIVSLRTQYAKGN